MKKPWKGKSGDAFRRSKTKETEGIMSFRLDIGLNINKEKYRDCLRCDRRFLSSSPANRLCVYCGHSGQH